MLRLIALDLDQTLFGDDLLVAEPVLKALELARQAGVLLTIVTGREARLASKFARDLGITTPIVCAQGGCLYDPVVDQVLEEQRLAAELLPRILTVAAGYGWNYHFETSDRLYFPRQSNHPPLLFELLRYSNWVRVGNLLSDMPEAPHKLIVTINSTDTRQRVVKEMEDSLGDVLSVVPSHPHLIEGLPSGVDKGRGLESLCRKLGIDRTEVLAIGDSDADVPMLEWAGLGVAMGNASPAAKAAARWIAPPLSEHGVAAAILKHLSAVTG